MKKLAKDAKQEKALKDVAEVSTKEKTKAVVITEKKAAASEKARVLAEKRSSELEGRLGETELKLAEAVSLNTAQAEEFADLKAALEACENKWYNEGFADAENSTEPIMNEARKLSFEQGWLAVLQALGVPKDSPLRNSNQIPFPGLPTIAQNHPGAIDEEETQSMRELVKAINSHVEAIDLKATNNLRADDQPRDSVQLQPNTAIQQPPDIVQVQPADPMNWLPNQITTVYLSFTWMTSSFFFSFFLF